MKKMLMVAILIATTFAVFIVTSTASATRGTGNLCADNAYSGQPGTTPTTGIDDVHYFPWGFLCGTSPSNTLDLTVTTASGANIIAGNNTTVEGNSTLKVTGSYTDRYGHSAKGKDGSPATKILSWFYVNTETYATQKETTITPVTAGGDATKACPGEASMNDNGTDGPGKVFGTRDLSGNQQYSDGSFNDGKNASPLAYDPDTIRGARIGPGVVNCGGPKPNGNGSGGAMVYWQTGPDVPTNTFKFDIKVPNKVSHNNCVKMFVSAGFGNDLNLFPPPAVSSPDTDLTEAKNRNTAAHIVKQSDIFCYDTKVAPPVGGIPGGGPTGDNTPPPYLGVNGVQCNADGSATLSGWASQDFGNSPAVINVDVYADGGAGAGGTLIASTNNGGRGYPNGNPSWFAAIPANYGSGGHALYVYAGNPATGKFVGPGYSPDHVYGADPIGVNCPPPDQFDTCFQGAARDPGGQNSRTFVNVDGATEFAPDPYGPNAVSGRNTSPGTRYDYVDQWDSPYNGNPSPVHDDDGGNGVLYAGARQQWNYKPKTTTLTFSKNSENWNYHSEQYEAQTHEEPQPDIVYTYPTGYYDDQGNFVQTGTHEDRYPQPDKHVVDHYGYRTWWSWDASGSSNHPHTCYAGTCKIDSIDEAEVKWMNSPTSGTGVNSVKAGQKFGVKATITSTGEADLYEQIYAGHLGLTGYGGSYPTGFRVSGGQPQQFEFYPTAPDKAQTINMSFTPYYPNWFNPGTAVGPACNAPPVDVYEPFQLTPDGDVKMLPTTEDPTQIDYYGTLISDAPSKEVHIQSTHSTLWEEVRGAAPQVTRDSDNGGYYKSKELVQTFRGSKQSTPPYPTVDAGDTYCVNIKSDIKSGWVGPHGPDNLADTVGTIDYVTPSCPTVHNKPYFKAFNGSISSGGDFNIKGNNANGGGEVGGWNNNITANNFGASSQLGIMAILGVRGVASGVPANGAPGQFGQYATFANSPAAPSSASEDPQQGGNFGGYAFFNNAEALKTDATVMGGSPTLDIGTINAKGTSPTSVNGAAVFTANGNTTLTANSNATLSNGVNGAVEVDGDLYIKDNLKYSNPNGWKSIADIPSLFIKVTGNIYIDPSVTEVDGVYIAQEYPNDGSPKSGTKGAVYTCANYISPTTFQPMNKGDLYDKCHNQLTVFGSMVAHKVNLMRTFGSLRDERNGNPATCSNAVGSQPRSYPKTCAAEVFVRSPEQYLGRPAIKLPDNGALKYNAITGLPPVL